MEITININGRMMSVEVSDDVAEYLDQAKRKNRSITVENLRGTSRQQNRKLSATGRQ